MDDTLVIDEHPHNIQQDDYFKEDAFEIIYRLIEIAHPDGKASGYPCYRFDHPELLTHSQLSSIVSATSDATFLACYWDKFERLQKSEFKDHLYQIYQHAMSLADEGRQQYLEKGFMSAESNLITHSNLIYHITKNWGFDDSADIYAYPFEIFGTLALYNCFQHDLEIARANSVCPSALEVEELATDSFTLTLQKLSCQRRHN